MSLFSLGRVVVFSILIALLAQISFTTQIQRTRDSVLNRFMPANLSLLKDINEGKASLSVSSAKGFINYFSLVNWARPKEADAYALKGFCYFHLKEYLTAYAYFSKAAQLEPDCFWHYYGQALCLLYLNKGQEAKERLAQALNCNPEVTLRAISMGKVYTDLLEGQEDWSFLKTHLVLAYRISRALYASNASSQQLPNTLTLF